MTGPTINGNKIEIPPWLQWLGGGLMAVATLAGPAWVEMRVAVARIDAQVGDLREDMADVKGRLRDVETHSTARPVSPGR